MAIFKILLYNWAMNDNEKRIIATLSRQGPLTRREIAAACSLSWAAVAKLVGRLSEDGSLRCLGESSRKTENGKTSLVYDIAEEQPLAIGIDIEYSQTSVSALNLHYHSYYHKSTATPEKLDFASLTAFAAGLVRDCREELAAKGLRVEGTGVGLPGMLLPAEENLFERLAEALEAETGLPAVVDNNIRSYTLFLQKHLEQDSFIAFVIRRGIGVGVSYKNSLFRGRNGRSAELGHLHLARKRKLCRCGRRGCVEAYCNQGEIAAVWARRTKQIKNSNVKLGEQQERALLAGLFEGAASGEGRAVKLVQQAARYLSPAVAAAILSFDIENVVLNGHFGPQGGVLAEAAGRELQHRLPARFHPALSYRPIDDKIGRAWCRERVCRRV
jgi:predicted NBD/HSP70 family sugar kinase